MSELQDAFTLSAELAPITLADPHRVPRFQHWCPNADFLEGAPINEDDPDIIHCRCYTSDRFFAVQDAMAVRLDAERSQSK